MKTKSLLTVGAMAFAMACAPALVAAPPVVDCIKLGQEVESAAAAKPEAVTDLVKTKIAATPSCACEIIKGAIKGSKADDSLTAAIVEAALRTAPTQLKVVVECALAVKPTAASQIRQVVRKIFGVQGGPDDNQPPKNPALLLAFILDGISPSLIGQTDAVGSGLAVGSAIPGGGASGAVFSFPAPIPGMIPTLPEEPEEEEEPTGGRPPFQPGGGGGATPTNPKGGG